MPRAEPPPPDPHVAHRGVVVTAPGELGDPFTVRVPDFDDLHVSEIRRWENRGPVLPAIDDEVLVVIDDDSEPWVVAWWPAAGDEAGGGGEKGDPGSVWYTGAGAPAGGTGVNGDLYLRTSNGDVYKKAGGSWSVVGNIMGPEGKTGAKGDTGAEGPKGSKGEKGDTGGAGPTGPVGATWRGAWSAVTAYVVNDLVQKGGASYIAIKAGTNHAPPNAEYWELVAEKGEAASAAGAFAEVIGDGASKVFVVEHGLGTRNVLVGIREADDPCAPIWAGFTPTAPSDDTIEVTFTTTPAAGEYVVTVIAGAGPAGPEGKAGAEGAAGSPGAAGSRWYNGEGAPAGGLGVNGDFYLRDSNGDVYEKAAGSWSVIGNIEGPEGPEGPEGSEGPKGEEGDKGGAFTQTIGDGATKSFTITHALGTEAVAVFVRSTSGAKKIVWESFDAEVLSATQIKVTFDTAPASGALKVLVLSGAGPEGPKGETGSKGEKGDTGAAGKDATVWEAANPIYEDVGRLGEEAAAATYLLGTSGVAAGMVASGTALLNTSKHPLVVYFDPADYEISGKTAKLVLRATVLTNATQPKITFTFTLRPITNAGAEKALALTAGAEVSGSKAEVKEPAASSFGTTITAPFTPPAKGLYEVVVTTSAKLTAKAVVECLAQLSVVWE